MVKSSKKILVVGTYPIKSPQHGGQKRLDAIVDQYRAAFKSVKYVSVFFEEFYPEYSADDIPLSAESELLVRQSPLTGDIVCGEAIFKDQKVKAKFKTLLQDFKPDIIHVEQPFPYLGVKPLLKEMSLTPKLIFGSQNIEGPMKEEILLGYGVAADQAQRFSIEITHLEKDFSKDCDLLVACTEADQESHVIMGATKTVLAPNGVGRLSSTPQDEKYWHDKFDALDVTSTAVFVGSAHPPNWAGFLKMVGKGLGFVPINARIVAAGSVSDYFDREIREDSRDIQDVTFWLRAVSAGRLSEPRLRAIISTAEVLLLPITEGGGSNLKTAEAILADKKVVTTSHALRSFEWFRDFPNVWVADRPEDFRDAIRDAFSAEKKARTKAQTEKVKTVLWKKCLNELVLEATKL